ncbi:MAG: RHS repeat-associated core domain-containing protein, partial [Flavobacteriales bacterium]
KDNEVYEVDGSLYTYELRLYDVRTGRFLSTDPLAAKYPSHAPYAFAQNKVIQFRELEGGQIIGTCLGCGMFQAYQTSVTTEYN